MKACGKYGNLPKVGERMIRMISFVKERKLAKPCLVKDGSNEWMRLQMSMPQDLETFRYSCVVSELVVRGHEPPPCAVSDNNSFSCHRCIHLMSISVERSGVARIFCKVATSGAVEDNLHDMKDRAVKKPQSIAEVMDLNTAPGSVSYGEYKPNTVNSVIRDSAGKAIELGVPTASDSSARTVTFSLLGRHRTLKLDDIRILSRPESEILANSAKSLGIFEPFYNGSQSTQWDLITPERRYLKEIGVQMFDMVDRPVQHGMQHVDLKLPSPLPPTHSRILVQRPPHAEDNDPTANLFYDGQDRMTSPAR